jgi:hypothetical protein
VPRNGIRRRLTSLLVASGTGRHAVALGFVLAGLALVAAPRFLGWEWSQGSALVDLGSELLGLALTVSILDWFFEQRRVRAEGRRLAWEVFHDLERATWVWQGGPLRLETDELLGLLQAASATDDIAPCTEGLLLGLGIRSRELLQGERRPVASVPGLDEALTELAGLARIGDRKQTSSESVRNSLLAAARHLAAILDLSAPHMPARLIRNRSAEIAEQERRCAMGAVPGSR